MMLVVVVLVEGWMLLWRAPWWWWRMMMKEDDIYDDGIDSLFLMILSLSLSLYIYIYDSIVWDGMNDDSEYGKFWCNKTTDTTNISLSLAMFRISIT